MVSTERPVPSGSGDSDVETRVPFAVVDELLVSAERFYDPGFFQLERDKLWTSTWQLAARLEDVPEPGDFIEYRIVDRSFLVVRQHDGSVKAFENACRHRATALGTGCGTFHGGKIVCPFHGWRFELDGDCSFVYSAKGFRPDTITPDTTHLVECQVATRWGMVFLNPDPAAAPFDEFMDCELGQQLDEIGLDTARVDWWRRVRIECNWKIALEAFLEAYHILSTHPELAPDHIDDEYDPDAMQYSVDPERGHGWIGENGVVSELMSPAENMIVNNRVMLPGVEGWLTQAQFDTMEQFWARVPDELTEDEFLVQFHAQVYVDGEAIGVPVPPRPSLGHAYVFPNSALISYLGNTLWYRFLPDAKDPEVCTWEIWAVSQRPADEPVVRPELQELTHQRELPPVYQQDASNMELQQRGIRSRGFTHDIYAPRYENMITNMHRVLDRYLAR
jgi:phenylpropionate dioxygenase-like ring-hydroxylating dioxygenase large terminal subunit